MNQSTQILSKPDFAGIEKLSFKIPNHFKPKKSPIWQVILLLGLLLFSSNGYAQNIANYAFSTNNNGSLASDMNSNVIDMSTGTTMLVFGGQTNASSQLGILPFDFYFMGTKMNQFSVNHSGNIQLGFTVLAPTSFFGATSNMLAPFSVSNSGGNISSIGPATNGKIHYKVFGTYPNRCLVIEFQNMRISQVSTSSNTSNLSTYQARLYEKTGAIEYVYGNMYVDNLLNMGNFAVGIASSTTVMKMVTIASHAEVVNPVNIAPYSYTPSGVGSITQLSSSSNGSRRYYRFVPSAPANPTNLAFSGISVDGMFLSWSDNSTNETGFDIYVSDNGGTSYKWFTSVTANTNTLNTSNVAVLKPGTTYHWQVFARKESYSSDPVSGNTSTLGGTTINATAVGGSWTSNATWVGGVVPSLGQNVVIPSGSTVTIDGTNLFCRNLTVNGVLEYSEAVTGGLTVGGDLSVPSGGSFSAGAGSITTHSLVVGGASAQGMAAGNINVEGTLDLNTSAGVLLTINGYSDGQMSGSGSMDYFSLTFQKGGTGLQKDLNPTYELNSVFTVAPAIGSQSKFTISAGTVKVNAAITIYPYAGSTSPIASAGRLWLNHAGATISQNTPFTTSNGGNMSLSGELKIDAGTFTYGSGGGSDGITLNTTSSVLNMSGGTLNVYGSLNVLGSSTIQFLMSGGTINIDGNNPLISAATANFFAISSAATVVWTGGTVIVKNPHASAGLTAVNLNSGGNKLITGGTLQIGDANSTVTGGTLSNTSGFGLLMTMPVWNLVIKNRVDAFSSRMARLVGQVIVNNDLTIDSNGYLFTGSATTGQNLTVRGNINVVATGSMRGAEVGNTTSILGTIIMNGVVNQSFAGLGTVENLFALTLQDTAGVTLNRDLTVTQLNLNYGLLTIGSGKTLTLGRNVSGHNPFVVVGSGSTLFSAGSLSSVPTFETTAGNIHLQYLQSSGAITLGAGNEVPNGATINARRLLVNNSFGVILGRAVNVDTLTMTNGDIKLGDNDLTLGTSALTPGSFTYSNGNIISNSNGLFVRWLPTSGLPTSVFNGSFGHFPMGVELTNRHLWLSFSSATALSTGGRIAVSHNGISGTNNFSSQFLDTVSFSVTSASATTVTVSTMANYPLLVGDTVRFFTTGTLPTGLALNTNYYVVSVLNTIQFSVSATKGGAAISMSGGTGTHRIYRYYTPHKRTNASWSITAPTLPVLTAGQTISLRIQGTNTLQTIGSLVDVVMSGPGSRAPGFPAVGTGTTTSTPTANRTGFTTVSSLLSSYYLAAQEVNFGSEITTIFTAKSGDWGDATTWSSGTVPTSSANVIVLAGHVINLTGGTPPFACNNLTINSGGILNASENTLTIGPSGGGNRSFLVSGTLNVSGTTTINVNGNMAILNGSSFSFSAGNINVDGNDGTLAGSVNTSTDLFSIGHATLGNFSTGSILVNGGTLTIVDPPYSGTTSNYAFAYRSGSPSNVWAGNTIVFGGTTGLHKSGHANGFYVGTWLSSGRLLMGNVVVNGENLTSNLGGRFVAVPQNSSLGFDCINLTVNANSELRQNNVTSPTLNESILIAGNLVNNGLITTQQTSSPSTLVSAESGLKFAMLSNTSEVASIFNQTISGSGNWRNCLPAVPTGYTSGTNYQIGDVITLTSGTSTNPIKFYITSVSATGGISGWGVQNPGLEYSVLPVTFTMTGGSGTGGGISTLVTTAFNRTAHLTGIVVSSQSGNSTQIPAVSPIEWDIDNLNVERITFANGIIKLDENNLTLGRTLNLTSATYVTGSMGWATPSTSVLAGFTTTTGNFRKVISNLLVTTTAAPGTTTTTFPTAIVTSSSVPNIGVYPMLANGFNNRYLTMAWSLAPTLTARGVYAVRHLDTAGTNIIISHTT
jgi:hypothetical protein